jgi:hypothetical protein
MPKVSKNPDKNWKNDAIQFPRLIAELQSSGGFNLVNIGTLAVEMDLSIQQVCELIDRACTKWDAIKAAT